jgi:hypothetical protein
VDFAVDGVYQAVLTNPERYTNPERHTSAGTWWIWSSTTHVADLDPSDAGFLIDARRPQTAGDTNSGASAPAAPADVGNALRCVSGAAPGRTLRFRRHELLPIFQSPGLVILSWSRPRPASSRGRMPHLRSGIRRGNGDSRADGRQHAVVDDELLRQELFHGRDENLKLIERFTRVSPDTITYDDADRSHDGPGRDRDDAAAPAQRDAHEFACHEGNYHIMSACSARSSRAIRAPVVGRPATPARCADTVLHSS